ncbi:MAG TPA: glutamate-cysteine ligase family protein [Nocardioides sp.]|uniref:glutamate-cysteine ligase family protein n=1 Tax=Nocardioides sp. TaxID=35761 RepID=UPI002E2F29A3|nr:glutamate-cysteine ligase family protein [Nocardioides sp.]HEX5090732.1 glutamate-cysteine ligase family protein [Nocardioides sp.]
MNAVARLFPAPGTARTARVGIEHELLVRDAATGAPVPIERVRAATATALAFEPGGQVELNQPCGPAAVVVGRLRRTLSRLRADLGRAGIELDASAVDRRSADEVPLQLVSPRYVAMQAHFDTIGPAGRRMMRCTASTQICLDWWPGRAGLEQWRVLNLAGPRLAGAFARTTGDGSRLATWLAVDPDRTAFDDRLLRGACPVTAYAEFARRATAFTHPDEHLSTLFPPVRPRGRYLEVRFLDVQPDDRLGEVVDTLSALMYDDAARARTLAELEPEAGRLGELWEAAAAGDLAAPAERAVA